jgi:hypothetical protein
MTPRFKLAYVLSYMTVCTALKAPDNDVVQLYIFRQKSDAQIDQPAQIVARQLDWSDFLTCENVHAIS